ncbi:hypothetical protein O6H91_09G035900 [Diphasiastrum complanatum]|uniref:Uncharacterized protein n=1 Tax=Diphasiastrum complanatum TaxID=34168 RepID=A0ACC2CMY3_DIPCM|nr:hypothetical protein O6H91_09G035900 [Diphasiastrum complanatum]
MSSAARMYHVVDCTDLTTDGEDSVVEVARNDAISNDAGHIQEWRISELIETLPLSSKLRRLFDMCGIPLVVQEIPKNYNGNLSFQLPPSQLFAMDGMQRSVDCHNWVRYATTINLSLQVWFVFQVVEGVLYVLMVAATVLQHLVKEIKPVLQVV